MRKSACFTGHRTLMTDMNSFSALLLSVIEQMITDRNITDYYAGGAYGFDAIGFIIRPSVKGEISGGQTSPDTALFQ